MEARIILGRLFGAEIGLHYSWFISALLITLSLMGHFGATDPKWSRDCATVSATLLHGVGETLSVVTRRVEGSLARR